MNQKKLKKQLYSFMLRKGVRMEYRTYDFLYSILAQQYDLENNDILKVQVIFEEVILKAIPNARKNNRATLTPKDIEKAIYTLRNEEEITLEKTDDVQEFETYLDESKTFCNHCGNEIKNKEQVICEKCGMTIKNQKKKCIK